MESMEQHNTQWPAQNLTIDLPDFRSNDLGHISARDSSFPSPFHLKELVLPVEWHPLSEYAGARYTFTFPCASFLWNRSSLVPQSTTWPPVLTIDTLLILVLQYSSGKLLYYVFSKTQSPNDSETTESRRSTHDGNADVFVRTLPIQVHLYIVLYIRWSIKHFM